MNKYRHAIDAGTSAAAVDVEQDANPTSGGAKRKRNDNDVKAPKRQKTAAAPRIVVPASRMQEDLPGTSDTAEAPERAHGKAASSGGDASSTVKADEITTKKGKGAKKKGKGRAVISTEDGEGKQG